MKKRKNKIFDEKQLFAISDSLNLIRLFKMMAIFMCSNIFKL